jgi:pimeloyl-ACP methyl ester carboxylesterase
MIDSTSLRSPLSFGAVTATATSWTIIAPHVGCHVSAVKECPLATGVGLGEYHPPEVDSTHKAQVPELGACQHDRAGPADRHPMIAEVARERPAIRDRALSSERRPPHRTPRPNDARRLAPARARSAYLRAVIDSLPSPIIVAGHSYGGSVISEAADGATNVTALVYIASFNLEAGESTVELAAKFPGGELGRHSTPCPSHCPAGARHRSVHPPGPLHDVFAADVDEHEAKLMAATHRPIASTALEDIATKAAWKTIPSWTMVTRHDLAIPADSMRFMAE